MRQDTYERLTEEELKACLTPEQVDRIMELVEFGGYVPKTRQEGFRSDLYSLLQRQSK